MASPSKIPKKPTAVEFLKFISGARVDIYVGKNKKHDSVPKDLFCYYSTYFERCFNGDFKEAKQGKLELLGDDVEDFEILLQYILHGNIPLEDIQARFEGANDPDLVRRYMSILEYADKYNMQHCIGEILYLPIKTGLTVLACGDRTSPEDVEMVFRVFEKGHKLRKLVTQAALSRQGPYGKVFQKQEKHIPEFAYQMLKEIRKASKLYPSESKWIDPITGTARLF
ncbi:hypothetical protein ONS95_009364 [Cadophora gregata]|uniref:uncharacterized protein n=1 Tax=Cadophora gregata TaxID=51156 RepID=UPI0026DC9EFD|nr:uncharacterized protein ONS95_009364 [Cadophora gregata]KAK0124403.1 hypothetical protein ONS95_009364 [Cadophora gregata]